MKAITSVYREIGRGAKGFMASKQYLPIPLFLILF